MNNTQKKFSETAYNRICEVTLPIINSLASSAPNAKYTAQDILDVALTMSHDKSYAAPAIRAMKRRQANVMTGQRFLQLLGSRTSDDMLEVSLDMLEAAVKAMVDTGKLGGSHTVAIDVHLKPRYDKNKNPDLKGGQRKSGTNIFEGHMTAQVVSGKFHPTVSAYPIADGEPQAHFVGGLIENARRLGVNIDTVLMDRGFNAVAVIREVEVQGVHYIMPLIGNQKLYEIMKEVDRGTGPAVRPYTMTNKKCESVTGTLVIVRKKVNRRDKRKKRKQNKPLEIQDKYVAFLTNIDVYKPTELLKYIPKEYRARWIIETGYRSLEEISARTKSPKTSARLFLFYFSLLLTIFWLICQITQMPYWGPTPVMPLTDYVDCIYICAKEGRSPP